MECPQGEEYNRFLNSGGGDNLTDVSDKDIDRKVTKAQAEFLDCCEELGYGKMEMVIIRGGEPVFCDIPKESRKFGK